MLKKNSRVLYILQCALNDEIFNHVCYCETAKDLWGRLALPYEETSQENPYLSRRDNMLNNLSDEKDITHFCLMANEEVKDRDASENDDDDASTSDNKGENEEMEYDILDEQDPFQKIRKLTVGDQKKIVEQNSVIQGLERAGSRL